jgi:hypothetical protein
MRTMMGGLKNLVNGYFISIIHLLLAQNKTISFKFLVLLKKTHYWGGWGRFRQENVFLGGYILVYFGGIFSLISSNILIQRSPT